MRSIHLNCLKITLKGLVQGVGMRPFIYNLALSLGLKGQVYNDGIGVQISICGSAADCESFLSRLKKNPPPLARIDEIICESSSEIFDDFRILSSQQAQKIAPILSDFAICAQCEAEFRDPKNRRYHHAFINCTHCGPRFSIISSLPYDRKNTSMAEFKMCASCEREYNDPLNRRFHAQPTCCPNCGPKAFLKDLKGQNLAHGESAFSACAELLEQGKIIAIKGLGGFHLCCDGSNVKAINELRKRKNRPAKPLAIMCENEQMASALADFTKGEKKLLNSQLRPIVLAKKSQVLKPKLSQAIAPNIDKIGVFLAPTSFNLLLFHYFKKPIIATSANLSGEPIITSSHELCAKLNSVADFVLDHNRQILNPSDDSVVFYSESLELAQYIRTSRGLRPSIVPFEIPNNISPNSRIPSENSRIPSDNLLNSKIPSENSRIPKYTPRTPHKTILALGSELKNTFGIYYKGNIFLSPYIGDLKNIATKQRFDALLATFKRTYELEFTEIIADLHPHFSHTKDFEKSGQNIKKLAHHKAHIYSVMCENNLPLNADILGFAFDGTGYGEDSKIWGGEVFGVCESKGLKRLYHFDYFAMIGSQNAIKNIYFLAYALLRKYELSAPSFFGRFNQNQLKRLEIGLKAASVQTSSLGRIFDAVASIVLGLDSVSYDAQAPMELEALYDSSLDVCYEFSVSGEIISLKSVLKSILAESLPSVAATGFINGIAALIAKIAKKHEKSVLLGGGCFANKALLERTITLLKAQNTPYYLPKNLPAGDESIALGQLYYALKDENE
ncbi:carbamoyltransferase HypF [Campylobacter sp. 50012-21]|uniref:carbamoyltransferase HypF n=1 Tax=Campylobacter magnus TaxID=3026462 RepID=UPI0023618DC7|nr:carbamoyltransferase HypF [Campylobacter magnus]MDD0846222.1 carbamoyltransferase HypF [Campylobacter magnus]